MHSLPLDQREVLGMALLPEFTYQEIARLLKISPEQAQEKIFQAKAEFRNNLASSGDDQ